MKFKFQFIAAALFMCTAPVLMAPQIATACTGITLIAKDGSAIQARTQEWGAFYLDSDLMIVPASKPFKAPP